MKMLDLPCFSGHFILVTRQVRIQLLTTFLKYVAFFICMFYSHLQKFSDEYILYDFEKPTDILEQDDFHKRYLIQEGVFATGILLLQISATVTIYCFRQTLVILYFRSIPQ